MMRRLQPKFSCVFVALLGVMGALVSTAPAQAKQLILRALDKTTGQVSVIPVPVGQSQTFGSLRIQVNAAQKSPPEEREEIYAFLTIFDTSKDPEAVVFDTWMFGSSPAMSALDHPLYDVWVDGYEP